MTSTDRPASTWAWTQVKSANLDFQGTALTFLAFAACADDDLNSPSGYKATTINEVATYTRQDPAHVTVHVAALVQSGLLDPVTPARGLRIPEEAFAPSAPIRECSKCSQMAAFVVTYRNTDRDELCGHHAAQDVQRSMVSSIVEIEAVVGETPYLHSSAFGVRDFTGLYDAFTRGRDA